MVRGRILEQITDESLLRQSLEKVAPIQTIRLVKRHSNADFMMMESYLD